ncbi:MAG: hypothetical protein ACT4OX_03130 [Actinomycetota bacterium]
MIRCPGCSYLVPPAWDACRRCGTAMGTAAAPVGVAAGARPRPPAPGLARAAPPAPTCAPPAPGAFDLLPGHSNAPPRPRDANDLLPLSPLTPYATPAPPLRAPAPARGLPLGTIVASGVIVMFVALAWAVWPRGNGTGGGDTGGMEILPRPEPGELSISLDDAFRVQAEANLRMATVALQMVVAETGDLALLTPETLAQYDPSMRFVAGNTASTGSNVASLTTTADRAVVAVAGDAGICAFARIDLMGTLETVTVRTSGECRADRAPTVGWEGLNALGGGGVPLAPEFGLDIPDDVVPPEEEFFAS